MTIFRRFVQVASLCFLVTIPLLANASDNPCGIDSNGNTIVHSPQLGGGKCLANVQRYIVKIYKIGLCNNLQLTHTGSSSNPSYIPFPNLNSPNCTIVWNSGSTPTAVDITSTSSMNALASSPEAVTPTYGSYNYAYIVIGNTVSAQSVVTFSNTDSSNNTINSMLGSTGSTGMTCWTINSNDSVNNYTYYTQNINYGNPYSIYTYSAYNATTVHGRRA